MKTKFNLSFLLLSLLFLSSFSIKAQKEQGPNSRFAGVQIGCITYSYRNMPDQSLDAILGYIVKNGINSVELMGNVVENYLGIPDTKDAATLRAWRANLNLDKADEIKQMFDAKGVEIHILKLGRPNWSDEEIEYAFNLCERLGAQGLSMEINEKTAVKYAPFAERHNLFVIFHNHLQPKDPNFSFDKILAISNNLRLNFDAGHYYGATGIDPCRLVERLQNRIFSIHLKDKTGLFDSPSNENQVWGKGGSSLPELLRYVRDNQLPIYCDVELEYPVPSSSNDVQEVGKCVDFCQNVLEK